MKKLYKSTFMSLMLALCTFSFIACQEYAVDSQPEGPLSIQIDAQETYTALATEPSNIVFNVSSNTPWTITSSEQWCKTTPAMSAASSLVSEIVVSLESNKGTKARTVQLTIKAEGIETNKVITITQASKEDLVVIPYDEVIPTAGGKITFNLVSNKPWTIIPSTQFVENIDKTSGSGNENGEKETITITVPENTGGVRNALITVKTEFEEMSFTVTQDGIIIKPENDEEVTNQLNAMGGEKTIKIFSSSEWTVKVPDEYASWLSAEAKGSDLKLIAKLNNKLSTRVGHVLLLPKKNIPGFEAIPIEVKQSRNVWLDGGTETIDPTTGSTTITSATKSRYVTNFHFMKGRLIWTFEQFDLESGNVEFNHDTWWSGTTDGYGWTKYWIYPSGKESKLQIQDPFGWSSGNWVIEDVKSVRTIELSVLDDPKNAGKLSFVLSINGKEVSRHDGRNDIYSEQPNKFKGQTVYFGFAGPSTPVSTLTFKSFDYIPAE